MNRVKAVIVVFFFGMLAACGGGGGNSGITSGDIAAPAPPSLSVVSASQIDLSWAASAANVAVAGYRIYRNGLYLKSVSGTSTSDTGLTANTNYCYTVSAYDTANKESSKSAQFCITTVTGSSASGLGNEHMIGTLRNNYYYDLYSPTVALNDSNSAVATWVEASGDVSKLWANYFVNGSWSTPTQVSAGLSGSKAPSVAIDSTGNATAVWTEASYDSLGVGIINTTIWVSRYRINTGAWTAPVRISNAPSDHTYASEPALALDSAGNAVVVWVQDGIWSTSFNGSNWSAPQLLRDASTTNCGEPQVAIDGSNNVYVVWGQDTNAYYPYMPVGDRIPNIWARIYNSGSGSWGAVGLVGKPDLARFDGTERPRLAVNASGDVVVAWEETKGSVLSIVSNRFDKNISSWLTPTNVSVESTTTKAWPAVAIDTAGNAYIAWQESGTVTNGWMSRYDVASKAWTTPELFESDTQDAGQPAIGVDANGRALFVWINGALRARRYTVGLGWGAATTITSAISLTAFSLDVNSSGNAMAVAPEMTSSGTELDWAPYAVYLQP